MSEINDNSKVVEIPLTKGYVAIVDEVDSDLLNHKWQPVLSTSKRTAHIRRTSKKDERGKQHTILMHRVIMERILGRALLKTEEVDHINTIGTDNRRVNLRIATKVQNGANRVMSCTNTSGYKGVSFHKRSKKFRADITVNKKRIWLGSFNTIEEACTVYREAVIKYNGEFARFE